MKNILKIDFTTYIIIFISLLSGLFKDIIVLYIIIIIHELGHIFFMKIFHKKILKITIYPFGGITTYESLINHNIKEELLIALGGILFQLVFFLFIINCKFINSYTYQLFINNNLSLLIFNLIPLIPLDGSKIIKLIMERFLTYHQSNNFYIIIGVISLLMFIIYNPKNIILITFLIYKIIAYIKDRKDLENKFILERTLYDIPYKRICYDKKFHRNKLRQECLHFFNYQSEDKYLKKHLNFLKYK